MTFLEQNYLEKYQSNVMFNNLSDGRAAEVPLFLEKKPQLIARFVYTFISLCFIYLESYGFEINPRSFWELYNLSILSVHRIKDYI